MFSKSFVIAIRAVLDHFQGPSLFILGSFGTQNGGQNSLNTTQKVVHVLVTFLTSFEIILEAILEPKSANESDQQWDWFWNPPAPHLRGRVVAKTGNKLEV